MRVGDVFVAPSLVDVGCWEWECKDNGHPKPDKSRIVVEPYGTECEFWYSIENKNGSETSYRKNIDRKAKGLKATDEWLVVEIQADGYNGGHIDDSTVIAKRLENGQPTDLTLEFHQFSGFSDCLKDARVVRKMVQKFVEATQ